MRNMNPAQNDALQSAKNIEKSWRWSESTTEHLPQKDNADKEQTVTEETKAPGYFSTVANIV